MKLKETLLKFKETLPLKSTPIQELKAHTW